MIPGSARRTDLTVAHYKAPGVLRPGRVHNVKLSSAAGGAVKVSWSRATSAQHYRITVTTNGSHITQLAPATARSIVIRDVVPIKTATVQVTGELSDGLAGPTTRATYPQPKGKGKKPKTS